MTQEILNHQHIQYSFFGGGRGGGAIDLIIRYLDTVSIFSLSTWLSRCCPCTVGRFDLAGEFEMQLFLCGREDIPQCKPWPEGNGRAMGGRWTQRASWVRRQSSGSGALRFSWAWVSHLQVKERVLDDFWNVLNIVFCDLESLAGPRRLVKVHNHMETDICPLPSQREGKHSPWAVLFLARTGETMARTTSGSQVLINVLVTEQVYWGLKRI